MAEDERDESQRMLEALVRFVAATETFHDAFEAHDADGIISAVRGLYDARNIVREMLLEAEGHETDSERPLGDTGDQGRPAGPPGVEPPNGRRATSSRLYQGSCPMGHGFKGELTGPETPDRFEVECPVPFCGMIGLEAVDA